MRHHGLGHRLSAIFHGTLQPFCTQPANSRILGSGRGSLRRHRFHVSTSSHPRFHHGTSIMGSDLFDPHAYTSGRWLRNDESERSARHIIFDFEALCSRIIELCPGATAISACCKKEGGFNRVFIFTTNNGQRLIAKLPFPVAGPPKLTTQSEVATIQYLQANTSIPIPRILDWCDDASSSIGSEYIIMEHAVGVQLHQRWPEMNGSQQISCIDAIFQKVKELARIEFPAYGSLYRVGTPLNSTSAISLDEDFCLGPHCGAIYWDCNAGEHRYYRHSEPNHGPWSSLTAYCDGLIDNGVSRVPPDTNLQNHPRFHGSPLEHLRLLESGRAVIKKLCEDSRVQNAATPTLFHPDLHKRNIFVAEDDPTVITGIIDWQSASIEPAFWYADAIPDFARSAPDSLGHFDPDSEYCAMVFDLCVRFLIPKLYIAKSLDESLFRPLRYCYRTWKDGAVAFRHELIEISQRWKELDLSGVCPFAIPAPGKRTAHQREYAMFVAAQDLKRDLSDLLNTASDGWVSTEDWERTLMAHKEIFADMLQAVLANEDLDQDEPIRNEDDLREIWPFDL